MKTAYRIFLIYILLLRLNAYSQYATLEEYNKATLGCCQGIFPVGLINVSVTPIFSWTSVKNATAYHLQVFLLPILGEPLIDAYGIPLPKYQVSQNKPLPPNSPILWKVQAYNDSEFGPYCELYTFITGFQ